MTCAQNTGVVTDNYFGLKAIFGLFGNQYGCLQLVATACFVPWVQCDTFDYAFIHSSKSATFSNT
jgi:hypothetical protein